MITSKDVKTDDCVLYRLGANDMASGRVVGRNSYQLEVLNDDGVDTIGYKQIVKVYRRSTWWDDDLSDVVSHGERL